MPRLYDCCTLPGKEVLKGLALSLGMLDYQPEGLGRKNVSVEGKFESPEEIGQLMRQKPASHNELRSE